MLPRLFILLVVAGCSGNSKLQCNTFTGADPSGLCLAGPSLRAFRYTTSTDMTCATGADAGQLIARLSGTECFNPSSDGPVPATYADCDVSGLPAGDYVTASGHVLLPPAHADAGVTVGDCPAQ